MQMSNFRSNTILDFYKACPAVHYIPNSNNSHAFGDAVSIGARTSGVLYFRKGNFKNDKITN